MLVRLLREHLRPYLPAVITVVVLQIAQVAATLYLPTLYANIIDNGVAAGNIHEIWRVGFQMLAVSFAQVICAVGAVFLGARTAMALGRDVRARLFDRVQAFSQQEMGKFGAPTLITRTTNDVQQVQMVVLMTFTIMLMAPFMAIGGVIMALHENVRLSALMLVVVPVLAVIVVIVIVKMVPWFRKMQFRIDAVNRVMREQLEGVRVIRAFVREKHERERFGQANYDVFEAGIRTGMNMAVLFPTVMFVMNATSIAVMWFGGHLIDNGQMQMGSMQAFINYTMFILMAVLMSSLIFIMIPRAMVASERIAAVVDTEPTVLAPADPKPLPTGRERGRLELRGVEFRYPGAEHPVLQDVDLVAEPGHTTAIIGSTGAGKTTLVNLVPRLYDVTGGVVTIGGVDVRDLAPDDLWGLIGLVPQKPYLFSGTVRSNLQFGAPDATDQEMWHALEVAQARDFVQQMDGGLDAEIAQGGTNVSGGQRQRLAMARAIVRRPSIYLFDDSFSALDYATDAALRAALAPETRDATVVVVAQRVSTIRTADRIVVLDDGKVVGTGTHAELLETNPTYQEIVYSQLSVEEAA